MSMAKKGSACGCGKWTSEEESYAKQVRPDILYLGTFVLQYESVLSIFVRDWQGQEGKLPATWQVELEGGYANTRPALCTLVQQDSSVQQYFRALAKQHHNHCMP